MNAKQIAEVIGCTPGAAQQHVTQAQRKATQIGLRITLDSKQETEQSSPKAGSGMLRLKELAKEAGLLR